MIIEYRERRRKDGGDKIKWDTDGNSESSSCLPTEIGTPDDVLGEEVSDYLSYEVAYCCFDFVLWQ